MEKVQGSAGGKARGAEGPWWDQLPLIPSLAGAQEAGWWVSQFEEVVGTAAPPPSTKMGSARHVPAPTHQQSTLAPQTEVTERK